MAILNLKSHYNFNLKTFALLRFIADIRLVFKDNVKSVYTKYILNITKPSLQLSLHNSCLATKILPSHSPIFLAI